MTSATFQIHSLTSDLYHTKGQLATAQHDFNHTKSQLGECQINLDKFFVYKGHRYQLGPEYQANIDTYVAYRRSKGGYLVEIDDSEEWEFVKRFLDANNSPIVYVGASFRETCHFLRLGLRGSQAQPQLLLYGAHRFPRWRQLAYAQHHVREKLS